MQMPKHLVRPDHAEEILANMEPKARVRFCRDQVDRWREVVMRRPTARARDAHSYWLEAAAAFGNSEIAGTIGGIMFSSGQHMTPRQARRLVG